MGVRIESTGGAKAQDLAVEGVFLEIGLEPNTGPVKRLISLNRQNEIPVQRDQSTEIPGFFAAGNVTDEREKQISIAAGAGTRAALTVYQCILDRTRSLAAGGASSGRSGTRGSGTPEPQQDSGPIDQPSRS